MKITAYAKYGCKIFGRYKLMCAIIIIQLTAVLCALNIAIGNYNSRNMLYVPFEDILSKDGLFMFYDDLRFDENGNDLGEPVSGNDIFYEMFGKLKGDVGYTEVYRYFSNEPYSVLALPDEIYNALSMPLSKGSYANAVVTCNSNIAVGDSVNVGNTKIKISGVLTENTYIPSLQKCSLEMKVSDLYDEYKSESDRQPVVIAAYSTVKDETLAPGTMKFLYYNSPPTDEERAYNDEIIHSCDGMFVPLSEINERSKTYVNDNLKKIFPVAVCVGMIAMLGTVCCVSIITVLCLKTHAVLYLCGASLKDCIAVNTAMIAIIDIISAALLLIAMKIIDITGQTEKLGAVILRNNVLFSVMMYAFMMLISVIMIIAIFSHRKPKQMLMEGK